MQRVVETELLDVLSAQDEQAKRSRADLRRINWLMGNASLLHRLLTSSEQIRSIKRIVELGAGDGTFLLKLAKRLMPHRQMQAVTVDRQKLVSNETSNGFARIGWTLEAIQADVFDWLMGGQNAEGTLLIANLFLHHFGAEDLRRLFKLAADRCWIFAACEPRRGALSLIVSRLLGLIGCNAVTRHDAVASVRAGFCGRELSELWPANAKWDLREGTAGLFSHVFLATRKQAGVSTSDLYG